MLVWRCKSVMSLCLFRLTYVLQFKKLQASLCLLLVGAVATSGCGSGYDADPLSEGEFPVPITRYMAYVVDGSTGVEQSASGAFWWITKKTGSIRVVNTTDKPSDLIVSMVVQNSECGDPHVVTLSSADQTSSVEVDKVTPLTSLQVYVLSLQPGGATDLKLTIEGEPCIIEGDPRDLYVGIDRLKARRASALVPEVVSGTSGPEDVATGLFYWIVQPEATIRVTNPTVEAVTATLSLNAGNVPCETERTIVIGEGSTRQTIELSPQVNAAPVSLTVSVPAEADISIPVTVEGEVCKVEGDTRTFYAGLGQLQIQ